MCRNIRPLNNFEPPATRDEVTAAALQYVRKVAGTTKPSQANEEAFYAAVKEIAHITEHLLDDLVTTAPPKNREVEAAKARARAQVRYGACLAGLPSAEDAALDLLATRPLVVLTGAGLSTDSGIPDYRGPGSPSRAPMTYQEFVATPEAQQRYWARSHLGWQRMGRAEPNDGHRALAALDPSLLITQNVDGLHEAAGSRRLVALHGRVADVVCLTCRATSSRADAGAELDELNPGWLERHGWVESRPDGDVDLDDTARLRGADAARAAARSSPTWCSSARTCPPTGWPAATPPSRRSARTARCWSPARR